MDATGGLSARQGIDGAFWNANQKLTLHLTSPQTILLWRTSASCQQEQQNYLQLL